METFGNKIQQNSAADFYCDKCDIICSTNYNLKKHFLSRRHNKETKWKHLETNSANSARSSHLIISKKLSCEYCNKLYKSRAGLWKHNNICFSSKDLETKEKTKEDMDYKKNDIILKLLDQNASLQHQIIELSKEKTTVIQNNHTNVNNKFNMNFFLNEQCKDALNIMEFVNSLQIQLTDLENIGKLGYVEGISKIILNGLKELDIYKRPLHCGDIKREILYIKDKDKWLKEDDENRKMKEAIYRVTNKNIKQIPIWVEENPTCKDSESKKNDEYMNLILNCMSGDSSEETDKNLKKIISNVAKKVLIDK